LKRARSTPAWIAALATAGLLGGCVSGFDRNDQIVNSLRILGVSQRVENSYVADADIGDTVDLSALVVNPGGLSTVTVTWVACLPVPGQTQPCTDPEYLADPRKVLDLAGDPNYGVVQLGTGTDISLTIPDELSPLRDMLITRAQTQPNAECALYTQIPLLIVAVDSANNAVFAAVKNLRLAPVHEIGGNTTDPTLQAYVVNMNPQITGFNITPSSLAACDGSSLSTPCVQDSDCGGTACVNGACAGGTAPFPDGLQTICLSLAPMPPQNYYVCTLDGPDLNNPVPEEPEVTWYMSEGSLAAIAPPNNGSGSSLASRTFTGFTRKPGPFTIYGVVRDGRDGETWIAQDFQ
jgi:hypothetical protein